MRMLKNLFMLATVAGAACAAAGCDKAQLLAPTQSTINVTAATKLLSSSGETEISAVVVEQAGTPVQNGTTVRFTTNLGRIDPVETQTRNGLATTVIITPKPVIVITPINVTLTARSVAATAGGQWWEFTATATGGGDGGTGNAAIQSYSWDFGDGDSATTSGNATAHVYDTTTTEQQRTVTVTVRTADGRTATARTEILVGKFPL